MKVLKEEFGSLQDGTKVSAYTLDNGNGMTVKVMDYGAVILEMNVPSKEGSLDVLLGHESLKGYENNGSAHGAIVGRNANRIGGAQFTLNGKAYELDKNDGKNNLHGGFCRWFERMWKVTEGEDNEDASITFSLESKDMDQGFPGNVEVFVTYTLTADNSLVIHYGGVPDQDTIMNMTNHSYFNLEGHDAGSIRDHVVFIDSDYFTETDSELIPTGRLIPVKNTPLDFNEPKPIGKDIDADYEALKFGSGYDQNWVLKNDGRLELAATLYSPVSGIFMEVFTDLPGIQMYTGNFLNDAGKDGAVYTRNSGVALETQYFPDAVHHENFKQPVVKAGEEYDTTTVYKFGLR
ncbi:MAG: galactose mutarotase [Thermoflexaceae bacterium]|nr:galactose mutarotase [Thermoflexaceae bacterium]